MAMHVHLTRRVARLGHMTYKLVLLRHGQSEWNKTNQFTGWVDVPLTEKGREEIPIANPLYVQQPLIQAVVDHLLGKSVCTCDGESATLTNWVMDKILGKI